MFVCVFACCCYYLFIFILLLLLFVCLFRCFVLFLFHVVVFSSSFLCSFCLFLFVFIPLVYCRLWYIPLCLAYARLCVYGDGVCPWLSLCVVTRQNYLLYVGCYFTMSTFMVMKTAEPCHTLFGIGG